MPICKADLFGLSFFPSLFKVQHLGHIKKILQKAKCQIPQRRGTRLRSAKNIRTLLDNASLANPFLERILRHPARLHRVCAFSRLSD